MLLAKIKKDQLKARRDRVSLKVKLLTVLISDAMMIGKNNGNRETTDSEVITLIKKYIKGMEEILRTVDNDDIAAEITILKEYLPKQLSEDQIKDIVADKAKEWNLTEPKQLGQIMKFLKENYDGQFDGASASKIAKQYLS